MPIHGIRPAAHRPAPSTKAGPSVKTIQDFASSNGMFDDWKGFKPSAKSALQGEALAKFKLLAAKTDSWSGQKNDPKVFTATVGGVKTSWVTVENEHGDQAYVFDAHGRPLASGFMPETGDDFHWVKGFSIPDYVNQ